MAQSDPPHAPVVPLFAANPKAATCFSELEAYWQSLCKGRIMPQRSEIDPRGIVGALDRTFLVERVAPGVARFRLAGMHLSDLMGMEVRGMPLTCFFLPGARAAIAEAVEAVFSEPARVDLWLTRARGMLQRATAARMLLLPLRDDHGQVTRAIGCLSASATTGSPPHRFTITSDNRQTLIGYGQRPDGVTTPDIPAVLQRVRKRTTGHARPHLTVVKT
jgi:hypothetical protein